MGARFHRHVGQRRPQNARYLDLACVDAAADAPRHDGLLPHEPVGENGFDVSFCRNVDIEQPETVE